MQRDALAYLQSVGDGCLDIVASVMALRHFERSYRSRVLREIYRVRKPQGLFVNGDKYPPDDPAEFYRMLPLHLAPFSTSWDRRAGQIALKEVVMHELADLAPDRIMNKGEFMRQALDIGFSGPEFFSRRNFDAVFAVT